MADHQAGGVGEVTKGVICIFLEHADIWDEGKAFGLGCKRCCLLVPQPSGYWEVVVLAAHRPVSQCVFSLLLLGYNTTLVAACLLPFPSVERQPMVNLVLLAWLDYEVPQRAIKHIPECACVDIFREE